MTRFQYAILTALAIGPLTACALYTGDDVVPEPAVDAKPGSDATECNPLVQRNCPGPVDAGACDPRPADDVRVHECKNLCSALVLICPGASGTECAQECARFEYGTAYCPLPE